MDYSSTQFKKYNALSIRTVAVLIIAIGLILFSVGNFQRKQSAL